MTLSTEILESAQKLIGSINRKLTHLLPSPLTYAPNGWDTIIPSGTDTGWNHSGVIHTETEKWAAFCTAVSGIGPLGFSHEDIDLSVTDNIFFHNLNMTFGYVLAQAADLKSSLSILDYGGGLGHYHLLAKALFPEMILSYSCKETPVMAQKGQELNPDIRWFTDDSCLLSTYDLIMISGSLQYIQGWKQFLHDIATAAGSHLFLTRIPVVNGVDSFVAIQETYGTKMLHWQFNRAELLQAFEDAGFSIIREFLAGDCPYIKNAPEQCDLRGWLLSK